MQQNPAWIVRHASLVALLAVSLAFAPAELPGTWSIAAVDEATGQIGIAGASCTFNVQGIGEVVPGSGAVVVQGMSSDDARDAGMALLREGATPEEIVAAMRDERFVPEDQQYAAVTVDSNAPPAFYSGTNTDGWRGGATAPGVTVQGNSLVGEEVVLRSLEAFTIGSGQLAERLVAGLAAGADAGGDRRCGDQKARSAFVTVYNPEDPASTPYFHLVVYGITPDGPPAVELLVEEFDALFPRSVDRTTTRLYVTPNPDGSR